MTQIWNFRDLFSWITCYHTLCFKCIMIVLLNFKDLNFVDDKLAAKTVKFTSLENLYVYCIYIYPCSYSYLFVSLQEQKNKLRSNLGRLIVCQ